MSGDEIVIVEISTTLLSFSYLAENCTQLIELGVVTCLPELLGRGYRHDVTSLAVELLWNLLENSPNSSGMFYDQLSLEQLASGEEGAGTETLVTPIAESLTTLFRTVLEQGFREVSGDQ